MGLIEFMSTNAEHLALLKVQPPTRPVRAVRTMHFYRCPDSTRLVAWE